MADGPRSILWCQFTLARAVGRIVRSKAARVSGEGQAFCYVDTHGGSGRGPALRPWIDAVIEARQGFANGDFFLGLSADDLPDAHPGSWVLALRVIKSLVGGKLALEVDVNDIDVGQIEEAKSHREDAWIRFWCHDWFHFLRSRLALSNLPSFVFIDPPPDDARGTRYAVDAAILLETLNIPYMVSYLVGPETQESIDQIGRTGMELNFAGDSCGVVLGGGAETVQLDLFPDLRLLARVLDGALSIRLPRNDDYII
jgi:hypothetical protein